MKDEDASIMGMGSGELNFDVSDFYSSRTMSRFKSRKELNGGRLPLHNYSSTDTDKSLIRIKPSPTKKRDIKIIRRESNQRERTNSNATKSTKAIKGPSYGTGLEIESPTFRSTSTKFTVSTPVNKKRTKHSKKSKLAKKRKQKSKKKSFTPSLTMLSEFTTLSQTNDNDDDGMGDVLGANLVDGYYMKNDMIFPARLDVNSVHNPIQNI